MPIYTKLYQTELPHRAKLVYIYLHDRMDSEKKAWPGLNTIASDLSISRSTVKRAVRDLEKAGLIRKEPALPGQRKCDLKSVLSALKNLTDLQGRSLSKR